MKKEASFLPCSEGGLSGYRRLYELPVHLQSYQGDTSEELYGDLTLKKSYNALQLNNSWFSALQAKTLRFTPSYFQYCTIKSVYERQTGNQAEVLVFLATQQ